MLALLGESRQGRTSHGLTLTCSAVTWEGTHWPPHQHRPEGAKASEVPTASPHCPRSAAHAGQRLHRQHQRPRAWGAPSPQVSWMGLRAMQGEQGSSSAGLCVVSPLTLGPHLQWGPRVPISSQLRKGLGGKLGKEG